MRLCLIDTGVFLCLAFEDPGYRECGQLLDLAYQGQFNVLMSSIQLTELLAPFLRAEDPQTTRVIEQEIAKLKPKMRSVDRGIARRAAELRSSIRTPEGGWLSLADSLILSTALIEQAQTIYTIDTDFLLAQDIQVMAPQMEMQAWVKQYGTTKQRKALNLL